MKKFEYKVVSFLKEGVGLNTLNLSDIESTLTGEGLVGYEVIQMFDSAEKGYPTLCFLLKREINQE